jgi:tetratricopeptide (TPR) repeat protein
MLEDRVKSLCENGNWSEAKHAAETAVTKARSSVHLESVGVQELAISLEVKADLLRQLGEHEDAQRDYTEALELLNGDVGSQEQTGRISASLAVLHQDFGEANDAKTHYEKAIQVFEAMNPPAELDVADLSNNLAFIYEEEGNFDEAEALFLKALQISHEYNGKNNAETAAICNNLGALYQKCGLLEQAREMHNMALEARKQDLGPQHIDTGQSHGNLAVTLADSGLVVAAKEHFDKGLEIYEKHVQEVPGDYAAVASNYSQFLKNSGDPKAAQVLDKRVGKRLKKH